MHYNGPVIRPQTDADSVFIEVTVGCTHDSCTFCNFYDGYPFRVAPLEQVEADLKEAAQYNPHAKKVWASGGNPYALSTEKLAVLAKLFKKYLPEGRISTYARVDDLLRRSVEDMRYLKQLGFEDIVVGIESGDDEVLAHTKKGYTAADILEGCKKLEQAGVDYRVIYLGGLAGHGKAHESAKVTERERLDEFRTLLANMNNEIVVFSATSTNSMPFVVHMPFEKAEIVQKLDAAIDSMTDEKEARIVESRHRMTSV